MTTTNVSYTYGNGLPDYDPKATYWNYSKQGSGDNRPSYKRSFYSLYRYTDKRGRQHFKKVPTYRKPLRSVKDAPHNWSARILRTGRFPGLTPANAPCNSIPFHWGTIAPSWDNNDDNRLLAKLRAEFVGNDFDLGVFLGTGHQSLRTIADSATKLAKGIVLLKRGRILEAARTFIGPTHVLSGERKARLLTLESRALFLRKHAGEDIAKIPRHLTIRKKGAPPRRIRNPAYPRGNDSPHSPKLQTMQQVAASGWLELQYGWKPLVQDLKSGAEALAESTRAKRARYFVRRMVKGVASDVQLLSNSGGYVSPCTKGSVFRSKHIIAYMEESNVPTMRTLLDPLPVLWELTPWSFVVDWAIPIGEYLSVRGMASSLIGTFVTTELLAYQVASPMGQYKFKDNYYTDLTFNRVVSANLTASRPQVKSLGKIPSWDRAYNALALLQQLR